MTRHRKHLIAALEHLELVEPNTLEKRDHPKLDQAVWLLHRINLHLLKKESVYARPGVPSRSVRALRRRR